jgi:hypothetical protein
VIRSALLAALVLLTGCPGGTSVPATERTETTTAGSSADATVSA